MATKNQNPENPSEQTQGAVGSKLAEVLARASTGEDATTRQIERLQEQLAKEKDARKEDWFISIVIVLVFFNVLMFTVVTSIFGPVVLLVLQLLILIPLARKLGLQEISQLLDRLLSRVEFKDPS